MRPLQTENYRKIVVLTGAGISAASGLPTFRGSENSGLAQELLPVSDARILPQILPDFWRVYGNLRAGCLTVQPNAAHLAIANWQRKWADSRSITLVTQNVDELHQRAGSSNVIEIHGSLGRSRCFNADCPNAAGFADWSVPDANQVPKCELCGENLRMDVTLFNENLPIEALHQTKRALRDCDLFLAIGTSGTVSPASDFVRGANYAGARTIYLNLEAMTPPNPYFEETILGRAEAVLPDFLD